MKERRKNIWHHSPLLAFINVKAETSMVSRSIITGIIYNSPKAFMEAMVMTSEKIAVNTDNIGILKYPIKDIMNNIIRNTKYTQSIL